MAVAYDNVTTGHGCYSGSSSVTQFNHAIGGSVADGAVIVCLGFDDFSSTPTSISVDVDGSPASEISGTSIVQNDLVMSVMFGIATGSTTGNVTIDVSWTNNAYCNVNVVSFSGVDQTTPFDNGTSVGYNYNDYNANDLDITSETDDMTLDNLTARTLGGNSGYSQTFVYDTSDFSTSSSGSRAAGSSSNAHDWSSAANGRMAQSGCNVNASGGAAGLGIPIAMHHYKQMQGH